MRERKESFSFLSAFGIISTFYSPAYNIYCIAYMVNIQWPRNFEIKEV